MIILEPIDKQTTIDNIYDAAESIICTVEEENPEIAEKIIDVRDVILKKIEEQSIIEPEVRYGRWIEPDSGTIGKYRDDGCVSYYTCSCCKEISKTDYDFCPNCGVQMDRSVDNV